MLHNTSEMVSVFKGSLDLIVTYLLIRSVDLIV
jgi:hypothetical protein